MPTPIAEKLNKKVSIRLGGRDWPLVITHNTLIECEDVTGLNVLTGEANLLRPSAKLVRGILYCALQRAGAPYTIEQVGEMITPHNMVPIRDAVMEAWMAAMPEPENDARPTIATVA